MSPTFRSGPVPCRGITPLMYDELGVARAKAVCAGCPVREACLEFALANDERWGVWGGTSERQRRAMRAVRVRERRVAEMSPA
jgi:WhiB family redox-sensing transcriptional regulator